MPLMGLGTKVHIINDSQGEFRRYKADNAVD